ncbi:hypothetical protein LC609_33520 [Nostoc sp. XA013]|nr:hypothetical protein [Nostoc sp. XA013]
MEPLTTGAIALTAWLLNKVIDWSAEKALDQAAQKVMELLKEKSPDTVDTIEGVVERSTLPQSEREDIGEAVLIEQVKKAAGANLEIKAAVEALGNNVNKAAKENPELNQRLKEKQSSYQSVITNNIEKVGNLAQKIIIQNQTQNF